MLESEYGDPVAQLDQSTGLLNPGVVGSSPTGIAILRPLLMFLVAGYWLD